MREITLRMQVLQAERRLSRAAHTSLAIGRRGVIVMWGVTAGKASHNASNARGVTAGKMGHNSSQYNQLTLVSSSYSINSKCLSHDFTTQHTLYIHIRF